MIQVGEPAPWFSCRTAVNPQFRFDTVAGRYIVLCFFGTAADEAGQRVLTDVLAMRSLFDDQRVCFFGVSTDTDDETTGRVQDVLPGIRFFWDFDRAVSRRFGAAPPEDAPADAPAYRRFTVVFDERLRALAVLPFDEHPEMHAAKLRELLEQLPAEPTNSLAPVLIVPRVFEPELCRALIDYYQAHGGEESGFMQEVGGKTVQAMDYGHKRRRDQEVLDEPLRKATMFRIHDRLAPEVHKAFQFRATRIERYIVACYDSQTGGHFRPHRDNTTKGTAHRRFAVSLNLNGDFDGGDLRFPEFGRQTHRAPLGGAVVFSCSLLHEATSITRGTRYAFLPFLYDEQAAQIRQANLKYVQ